MQEDRRRAIEGFGLVALIGIAGIAIFSLGALHKLGYIGNSNIQREQYVSPEEPREQIAYSRKEIN